MKPERIMDAASCQPSDAMRSEGHGATLRWPRLLSLSVLALLDAGFNGIYARPAPTLSEWAVFSCLLMLIFLETLAAGWYRGQRKIPRDLRRSRCAANSGIRMPRRPRPPLPCLKIEALGKDDKFPWPKALAEP